MGKTVAIIGAGPAGLSAAKEALEAGLDATVFEKRDALGGVWHPARGQAWAGMRTNISRFTCNFSDYPWPAGAPDYPTGADMAEYLGGYARAFGVTPRIRAGVAVRRIERDGGGWRVTADGGSALYDHVVVAGGAFHTPSLGGIGGAQDFRGPAIHSAHYKSAQDFQGLRVAVIGGGFSGNEIASDLAAQGVRVVQAVRTPVWVLRRYMPGHIPLDLASYNRKARDEKEGRDPVLLRQKRAARFNSVFGNPGQADPRLAVDEDAAGRAAGVSVSDDYLGHVKAGRISIVAGGVTRLEEDGVRMADGARFTADAVIFCTGYAPDLPFLPPALKRAMDFRAGDGFMPLLLHRETFHPCAPGLAFSGFYRGPYFGVMELQGRWAAGVFAGHFAPPSPAAMQAGIAQARAIRDTRPRPQFPHADHAAFADAIAKDMGVWPDPAREPPDVAALLYTQSVIPAHYRLQGHGAKRNMALGQMRAAAARARPGAFPGNPPPRYGT